VRGARVFFRGRRLLDALLAALLPRALGLLLLWQEAALKQRVWNAPAAAARGRSLLGRGAL
jgi:hypothetical protein